MSKKKFFEWVCSHRKWILVFFAACAVASFLCKPLVAVNYDMNAYLPEDSPSTISLELMQREFGGGIPNARVMLKETTIPQALAYKEKLLQIEGVTDVTWLDDAMDVTVPLNMADRDTVETYYKDNNALFSLTIADDKRVLAVDALRELIGEENAADGSAIATATATKGTVSEIPQIAVIAVLLVLLILLLTTTSWVEPLVVLCGLGVAIIINGGSNLIFGEISFVTNAAGNILQLAVSLDYSVFLLHRFMACRKETDDVKEAMVNALCKSTSSILSSGLTTVIGFLALCLMRFRIGPDLGLALAKGIAISLIVVFVFSPALILSCYRLIDKTHHRSFIPGFTGFGKLVQRVMLPALALFALLIVPANLASNRNDFYYGSSYIFGAETPLGRDIEQIEKVFGKSDTYVLLVPKGNLAEEQKLSAELKELPQVTSIISYVDMAGAEIPIDYLDNETLSLLMSEQYSRFVLSLDTDLEGNDAFALVEEIRQIASQHYPQEYYLAGEGVSTYDLMSTITGDMVKVNVVAILAVFLVLLITMKSVFLPIILVLSIETAIWINLAVPYFSGSVIFYIAYLIISSVQLGATVDYAILLTERYREMRHTFEKKEAVVQTLRGVTLSILTSGIVLTLVGFLLGIISTHGVLSQLGLLLGRGTLCSLGIVLFVLPGLLYLFDRWVVRGEKKKKTRRVLHNV